MQTAVPYRTLARLRPGQPVDRLRYVAEACRDRVVLDIGCLDETVQAKRNTQDWLHGRIAQVARRVIGIDASDGLPAEGLQTGPTSHIYKGDGINPTLTGPDDRAIEVVVAGEFIEHIPSPLAFLENIRDRFPGRQLLLTTPNGTSFANGLLGTLGREAQHPDHLMTSTYKTLNTLCMRAGFVRWNIVPYRFFATEMKLASGAAARLLLSGAEAGIRVVERMCPLRAFGYIVHVTI